MIFWIVSPQIGVFTFGEEPLNAGDIASVTCSVTKGDLPIEINWMFGNEIVDEKREDISVFNLGKRGKQLSIDSVGATHAGEYTCVASNSAGSTSRTAVLNVNGILWTVNSCAWIYFDCKSKCKHVELNQTNVLIRFLIPELH